MNFYKIAELIVGMENEGDILLKRALPYQILTHTYPDFTIQYNNQMLKKAKENYPNLSLDEFSYIKTGFAFSRKLLEYEGFCLHSSAVALDNKAVLFSAPCGTGKSTHTNLWQKYFGEERAIIINDDKPALRFMKDDFYVFGTPWSGKTNQNCNIKVPLQAVVFIEQSKDNHIERLSNKDAVKNLIYQSLRPQGDVEKINKLLSLIERMVQNKNIYKMGCTISTDAVKLAYETINDLF